MYEHDLSPSNNSLVVFFESVSSALTIGIFKSITHLQFICLIAALEFESVYLRQSEVGSKEDNELVRRMTLIEKESKHG